MKLNDYLNYGPDVFDDYYECPQCFHLADNVSSIYKSFLLCKNCNYLIFDGVCSNITNEDFLKVVEFEESPIYKGIIALENSHTIDNRKNLIVNNLKLLYEKIDEMKIDFEQFFEDSKNIENPSRNIGYFLDIGSLLIPIYMWNDNNWSKKGINDNILEREYILKETFEECMENIDEIVDELYKHHIFKIYRELSENEEKELLEKYSNDNVIKDISWITKVDKKNKRIYKYNNNGCEVTDYPVTKVDLR